MEIYRVEKTSTGKIAPTPWKNGQGTTLELAKFPEHAHVANLDFLWRVSIATIKACGPFSPFPHFDRKIVLLGGPAPTLVHKIENESPTKVMLRPFEPHSFAGESSTDCSFSADAGSCRDFNVMTRRGEITAAIDSISLAEGDERTFPVTSAWYFLYVEQGTIEAATGQDRHLLEAGDLLALTRKRSINPGCAPVALDLCAVKGNSLPVLMVSLSYTD